MAEKGKIILLTSKHRLIDLNISFDKEHVKYTFIATDGKTVCVETWSCPEGTTTDDYEFITDFDAPSLQRDGKTFHWPKVEE